MHLKQVTLLVDPPFGVINDRDKLVPVAELLLDTQKTVVTPIDQDDTGGLLALQY